MENNFKPRVLLVGGFPGNPSRLVYGGQVMVCTRLLQSSFVSRHVVTTFDTTQISNPPPSFLIRLILAIKRILRFFAMLIIQKPDVVIIFLADAASALEKGVMARFAKLCGVHVMVFPRAGGLIRQYFSYRLFAFLLRYTLGKSDMFLCQGLSFQRFAVQQLGFLPDSAPVIPNWTASDSHLSIGSCRNYLYQPTTPQVLFLGWLEEFKGVFELLEAVRLLSSRKVQFCLAFGGNGAALPKAKSFVQQHSLNEFVRFYGWVDEEEKASLLKSSQIFVLPSWNEGLPNAMIEAMSAGLACVVTKVGMIPDYVTNGEHALLVEVKDVGGIADALKMLVCNLELRKDIATKGFNLASSNFKLENGAELLSKAVAKVCHS